MDTLQELLVALHVMGNLVWIGSIAAVGWITGRAYAGGAGPASLTIGELARQLYRTWAVPGFVLSFSAAVARVLLNPTMYFKQPWFHGKLAFALAAIALHHVIGAKAKKVASGGMQAGQSSAILTVALLACAFVAVLFVSFKSLLAR